MAAEEVRSYSPQPESKPVLAEGGHRLGVGQQRRAGALVDAPGARRRHVDARVRVSQAVGVSGEDVGARGRREKSRKGAPRLGKHTANPVKKRLDLPVPAQK